MPSTLRHTTFFGSGRSTQPAATITLRARPVADSPAVFNLQKVNDSGTVTNQFLWFDHLGRLRTGTTYPTNQDSDGRDITGSLGAGTVTSTELGSASVSNAKVVANTITPGLLSASSREIHIRIPLPSLSQGTDVSNRAVYRNTSVTTLNAGSCFIRFDRALGGPIGTNSVTLGLGVSAARDLFTRSFTTTQAAGSLTSLTAGSVTTVAVSTNVRLDITTAANLTFPAGEILWYPQKRGSA